MFLTPFGYKIPDLKDGNWWDQIKFNLLRLSAHSHDGVDSGRLSSTSFTKTKTTLSYSNWTAIPATSGYYKQVVAMPDGLLTSDFTPLFFVDGGADSGKQVFLGIKILSDISYEVYSNNQNLSVKVIYV